MISHSTKIQLPIEDCTECTSYIHSSHQPYVSTGNFDTPKLLIVQDTPGDAANASDFSINLQGASNSMLKKGLEKVGFDIDSDIAVTYVNMCNPVDDRSWPRKATTGEKKRCKPILETVLNYFKDKVDYIVTVGAGPTNAVLGITGINEMHGEVYESKYGKVYPVYSQGFVERKPHLKKLFTRDLQNLYNLCNNVTVKLEDDSVYEIIRTKDRLNEVYLEMTQSKEVSIDLEATGLYQYKNEIMGFAITNKVKRGYYIPLLVYYANEADHIDRSSVPEFSKDLIITKSKDPLKDGKLEPLSSFYKRMKKDTDKNEIPDNLKVIVNIEKSTSDLKDKSYHEHTAHTLYKFWGDSHNKILDTLKSLATCMNYDVIGANYKFDMKFMQVKWNVKIENFKYDVGLASYLIDENKSSSIKALTELYFEEKAGYERTNKLYLSKTDIKKNTIFKLPLEVCGEYACTDVDVTFRLRKKLFKTLEEKLPKLNDMYFNMYVPLNYIYLEAEMEGCLVDRAYVEKIRDDFLAKQKEQKDIMMSIIKPILDSLEMDDILLSSCLQKSNVFFKSGFLPNRGYTNADKNQFKTSEEVFTWLKSNDQLNEDQLKVVYAYMEWQTIETLLTKYVYAVLRDLDENGKIYYSFNLKGAKTGRPSASRIPIQTIPRDKLLRRMFRAPDGWKFFESDYSQIEFRLLGWFSNDQTILNAYANNEDLHIKMASQIYEKEEEAVTEEERPDGKQTNFQVIYGGGGGAVAQKINENRKPEEVRVSKEFGERCVSAFYILYPGVQPWKESVFETCRRDKYVENPFGRRRRLVDINSKTDRLRLEAERQAVNALIQGFANDLMLIAIIRIWRWLKETGKESKFIFSVHDAAILIVKDEELKEVSRKVKELMEMSPISIPTPASAEIYDRWKGNEYDEDLNIIKEAV